MEDRFRGGIRVAKVSIIVNLGLAALKGFVGYASGSSALVADAAHSLGDVLSTIPVIVGFSIAKRPADHNHPYGHGRAEELMTGMLSMILLVTAFLVARDGIANLADPDPRAPGPIAMGVAAVSILVKEAMFRYALAEGRKARSDLLVADAWHHRSDAMSSLAALVGIIGANAGIPILDPIAALAVAAMLAWTAVSILRSSAHTLMDGRPSDFTEELERVKDLTEGIPGIVHVDEVRMRLYGGLVVMDVEISVDASYTVGTAHSLASELRMTLEEENPHIGEVFVHINPHPDHDFVNGV